MEVAPVFSRHHAPSRFRGDRAGLAELVGLFALAVFLLLAVFNTSFWQAVDFVRNLIGSG